MSEVFDIFIHTYGLDHFRGSENEYFGGMKKLWIFLGGHYIPGST